MTPATMSGKVEAWNEAVLNSLQGTFKALVNKHNAWFSHSIDGWSRKSFAEDITAFKLTI